MKNHYINDDISCWGTWATPMELVVMSEQKNMIRPE